jgi:hypothetical protein
VAAAEEDDEEETERTSSSSIPHGCSIAKLCSLSLSLGFFPGSCPFL